MVAGDWIKMRVDLHDDPAVIAIGTTTELDEDAVVGKLHKLWSWADRQTVDGNAPSVTPAWLDRYVRAPGFAQAMIAVGWLSADDAGVTFPRFEKHNGETAKKRALTATRAAKHRNKSNAGSNAHSVTESVTKGAPREEKRREEKNTKEDPPTPRGGDATPFRAENFPIPDRLDTPEFRVSWGQWCEFRRSKRNPISEAACKAQMTNLTRYGPEIAIRSIAQSIANDWKGLFPEKEKPRAGTSDEAFYGGIIAAGGGG